MDSQGIAREVGGGAVNASDLTHQWGAPVRKYDSGDVRAKRKEWWLAVQESMSEQEVQYKPWPSHSMTMRVRVQFRQCYWFPGTANRDFPTMKPTTNREQYLWITQLPYLLECLSNTEEAALDSFCFVYLSANRERRRDGWRETTAHLIDTWQL